MLEVSYERLSRCRRGGDQIKPAKVTLYSLFVLHFFGDG